MCGYTKSTDVGFLIGFLQWRSWFCHSVQRLEDLVLDLT